MKFLVFFLLCSNLLFGQGQGDREVDLIIGKYSFRPFSTSETIGKMLPGDSGDLQSYTIRFPKRIDTLTAYGHLIKEGYKTDRYYLSLLIDSVPKKYIDTLATNIVTLKYKKLPRKVKHMRIEIMYSDGSRSGLNITSGDLSEASNLLLTKRDYSFIILSQIRFDADNAKEIELMDLMGWKIVIK